MEMVFTGKVVGMKYSKGEMDGNAYDSTKVFVEVGLKDGFKNESGEGKGRGVSTTSYSIGDASEYAKCEHLPLPFMAEFKMEMVTNGSEVTFKPVKGGFKPLGVVETAFEQVAGDKVAGPTPVKANQKAA